MIGAAAAALATLFAAAPADAYVAHTVQPGETLWSIAAASNFTTRSLAAANGLPETAQVVAGQTIQIPSEYEASTALQGSAPAAAPAAPAPASGGGYSVQWGDTLSAIAARNGVSVRALAAANGLDPAGTLVAGTSLTLPGGGAPASGAATSGPQPTNERVSPQTVGQLAVEHGVSPSLANAVAEQESGHNNALTSSAGASGVMQIMPGTWKEIQTSIAGRPLNPASAYENVHAGVMYLGRLVQNTGNVFTATAAYYQGEASVRQHGLFADTQDYVNNVMALRARYGPH
jgi:N-acetylmuramoyl-L-alanine amidase